MGSSGSSSRSENEFASLFVNIQEPEHFTGQMVHGHVEIRVKKQLAVHSLDLVLKGKEKTHWTRRVKRGKRHHTRHYYGKRDILRQMIPLVTYSGNVLEPGHHKIEFHFQLPQDIPGSFVYYNISRSSAKVQYQVNAELTAIQSERNLKFKRIMLISRKMLPVLETKELSDARNIKNFCCFSKGLSKIRARFEQSSYFANQTARTLLQIDNTNCTTSIVNIKLRLKQKLLLESDGGSHLTLSNVVAEQVFQGIGKQERTPSDEWRFIELNLNKFSQKYLANQESYTEDVQKHYGNFFLQPSTKSSLIDCYYYVQIVPEYDVLSECCSNAPKISLPINLGVPQNQQIPAFYPAPEIFSQPYQGEQYDHVAEPINLVYQPEYKAEVLTADTSAEPLISKKE